MPDKSGAQASSTPVDIELAPDTSSSTNIPNAKPHTPTPRRSLEIEDPGRQSRIRTRFEKYIPPSVVRWNDKLVTWVKGPSPPQKHTISPLFESLQTFPVRTLARLPSWLRAGIYLALCILWAVLFAVILTNYSLPTNLAGFGKPMGLSCVTNLWYVCILTVLQHSSVGSRTRG
jgi:hypothetical protein